MNKNLYKPLKKYPKYYDFLQSFRDGYNQLKDKNNLLPTLVVMMMIMYILQNILMKKDLNILLNTEVVGQQ